MPMTIDSAGKGFLQGKSVTANKSDTEKKKRPISAWREEEKPREKLMSHGVAGLTEAELIALLIGSGTHRLTAIDLGLRLLEDFGGLPGLAQLSVRDLCRVKGIGPASACKLLAAFELGRRKMGQKMELKRLRSPEDIASYIRPWLIDLPHEEFYVIYLNSNLRVQGKSKVSQGGVNATLIDPKIVFREAMMHRSPCIVLCHNHPSGNPNPSQADHKLTEKLVRGAQLIDSKIIDHIIVAQDGFYSYQESGRLGQIYAKIG